MAWGSLYKTETYRTICNEPVPLKWPWASSATWSKDAQSVGQIPITSPAYYTFSTFWWIQFIKIALHGCFSDNPRTDLSATPLFIWFGLRRPSVNHAFEVLFFFFGRGSSELAMYDSALTFSCSWYFLKSFVFFCNKKNTRRNVWRKTSRLKRYMISSDTNYYNVQTVKQYPKKSHSTNPRRCYQHNISWCFVCNYLSKTSNCLCTC